MAWIVELDEISGRPLAVRGQTAGGTLLEEKPLYPGALGPHSAMLRSCKQM